jgi:uncharacterized oxidoreductase
MELAPASTMPSPASWETSVQGLERFTEELCSRLGAPPVVAKEVAVHLVGANRAGHGSHGVIRLPAYVQAAGQGELVPAATPVTMNEMGAAALFDGRLGFGHYSTRLACEWAAERAGKFGIGCVAVRHSGHIGRLGHYLELLADKDLVGIVTVGMAGPGVGAMVLPGTAERFFGANPWAIGIPVSGAAPVVVDISTAVVAEGKVQVALAEGRKLPPGCIVDRNGSPTEEPTEYFDGGGLLPLGGLLAGHKGFGLGLAAALVGSLCMIGDEQPSLAGASVRPGADPRGRAAGVFVIVVDPGAFGDRQAYEDMVGETLRAIRRTAGAGPAVRVPGEPEAAARLANSATVTLPAATRDELGELAVRFGLALPV